MTYGGDHTDEKLLNGGGGGYYMLKCQTGVGDHYPCVLNIGSVHQQRSQVVDPRNIGRLLNRQGTPTNNISRIVM